MAFDPGFMQPTNFSCDRKQAILVVVEKLIFSSMEYGYVSRLPKESHD